MKTGRNAFTLGVAAAGLLAFGFLGCSSDSGTSGTSSKGGGGSKSSSSTSSSSDGSGGSGDTSSSTTSKGSGGSSGTTTTKSSGSGGSSSASSSTGSTGTSSANCDALNGGVCANCDGAAPDAEVWTPVPGATGFDIQTQAFASIPAEERSGGFFSFPNSGWSGNGAGGDGKCDGVTNCVPLADDSGEGTQALVTHDDGFLCPWGASAHADANAYGGGFGLSFRSGSPTPGFDLSAYTGVSFQIYANPTDNIASPTTKLKFQAGLTDTTDGCGCTKCSDDPTKSFNLTGTKDSPQTVTISFADMTAGKWGKPTTPTLDAAELGHVNTFKWGATSDADWSFCIGKIELTQ